MQSSVHVSLHESSLHASVHAKQSACTAHPRYHTSYTTCESTRRVTSTELMRKARVLEVVTSRR